MLKPFHIGTKVLWNATEPFRVLFRCPAHKEHLWVLDENSKCMVESVSDFVHSDGSPLGEWVPIRNDSHDDGFEGSIDYRAGYSDATSRVNAILRGEVEGG